MKTLLVLLMLVGVRTAQANDLADAVQEQNDLQQEQMDYQIIAKIQEMKRNQANCEEPTRQLRIMAVEANKLFIENGYYARLAKEQKAEIAALKAKLGEK